MTDSLERGVRRRHRPPVPPQLGPFDPDAWYLGRDIAQSVFGKNWQSVLNDRNEGRPGPTATRVNGKLYYRGADLIEWLEGRREVR